MNGKLEIDMGSYRQLMHNLSELPRRVGLKVFRIALNAWGGVVRDVAKSMARKETGLLKKSLIVKAKIPDASYNVKHHGKPAYVIVGPSRHVVGPVVIGAGGRANLLTIRKATKFVLGGGKVLTRRPSRYAHLIERGHGGPWKAKAYPFIGPAQRVGASAGMNAFFDKMKQGIEREANALPK